MKLAAFDTGYVGRGQDPVVRQAEAVAEAVLVESLGYRYWFAGEHHEPWPAWGDPAKVLARVSAATRTIEVGAAAFLGRYHQPAALVATAVAVDRMVLGLSPSNSRIPEVFTRPEFDTVCVPKLMRLWPKPIWLFGRTGMLGLANQLGLPFGYSLLHAHPAPPSPAEFGRYSGPLGSIWVCVVCAPTREAALAQRRLIESSQIRVTVNVCGTPAECRAGLKSLVAEYRPQVLGIMPGWHTSEMRRFTFSECCS